MENNSVLYNSFKIVESNKGHVKMSSLEVVDLINMFRAEEGNTTLKRHDVLLRDIRTEVESLENAGILNAHNFVEVNYVDSKGEQRPCFNLNKAGVMQMLNKESALVRYKTQQYVESLENKVANALPEELLNFTRSINERLDKLEKDVTKKVAPVVIDMKNDPDYIDNMRYSLALEMSALTDRERELQAEIDGIKERRAEVKKTYVNIQLMERGVKI